MYFPNGFDHHRAIQLAGFVQQAYSQLEGFRENTEWVLQGNASLTAQLRYLESGRDPKEGILAQLDKELRRIARSKLQQKKGLPIGFIASSKTEVYLVFRGTMTTAEILRDLSIRLVPYPYSKMGKVHEGFIQTYGLFRDTILDTLKTVGQGKKLFITGHSLGAALATLAVPDIISATTFKSPVVYTFGSPRVGDAQFAEEYNSKCGSRSFRIANTCDLVVAIPFPVPFLSRIGGFFTHVDTPVDCTVQKEDVEGNHMMATYRAALEAAGGRRGFFQRMLR
jgi:triacylglycerol lipase